jgi:predicted MPP superfamily phosphohydrolase
VRRPPWPARASSLGWALGAAGAAGLAAWAAWFEPRRLVVRRHELTLPDWPRALDGLRVGVMADLHVGAPHVDVAKVARIVGRLNHEAPELVALLGDLTVEPMPLAEPVHPRAVAQALAELRAPLGVFAVLGNNDDANARRALHRVGIRVLEDGVEEVRRGGATLWVAGFKDVRTSDPDVEGVLDRMGDDGPVLALTHSPDLFPRIPARVALTLAGHTHGGQVNLPLLRRRTVPSWFGARYARGHVVESGRHLYVDPGVGTSGLPIRFGAVPRVSVLTLRG